MHLMCPTFIVYLFQNQLCFVLGGSPALLRFSLFLMKAKGLLFCNEEEKSQAGQRPAGDPAGAARIPLHPRPAALCVLCWVQDVTAASYCARRTRLPKSWLNRDPALCLIASLTRPQFTSVTTLLKNTEDLLLLLFLCPYSRYTSLGSNI